jgi:hypothetical protein
MPTRSHPPNHDHLRFDTEVKNEIEVPGTIKLGRPEPWSNLKRWLDQVFGDYHPLDDDHTFNDDRPSASLEGDGYTPNHLLL